MSKNMDRQSMGIKKKSWYFFRLQELVFEDENLDSYAKLIYAVLSKYADYETNICYPSLKTISKMAGCTKKTTVKYINELIKAGYIKKTRRKRDNNSDTSNLYEIIDLGYINDVKRYAREHKNEKLLNTVNERLQNHPIPTYEEVNILFNDLRKYNQKEEVSELEELYKSGYR